MAANFLWRPSQILTVQNKVSSKFFSSFYWLCLRFCVCGQGALESSVQFWIRCYFQQRKRPPGSPLATKPLQNWRFGTTKMLICCYLFGKLTQYPNKNSTSVLIFAMMCSLDKDFGRNFEEVCLLCWCLLHACTIQAAQIDLFCMAVCRRNFLFKWTHWHGKYTRIRGAMKNECWRSWKLTWSACHFVHWWSFRAGEGHLHLSSFLKQNICNRKKEFLSASRFTVLQICCCRQRSKTLRAWHFFNSEGRAQKRGLLVLEKLRQPNYKGIIKSDLNLCQREKQGEQKLARRETKETVQRSSAGDHLMRASYLSHQRIFVLRDLLHLPVQIFYQLLHEQIPCRHRLAHVG